MKVNIRNNTFNRVGTVLVAPDTIAVDFAHNVLNDVNEVIRITPPPSLLSSLGLKSETPASEVVALLKAAKSATGAEDVAAQVQSRGISKWLADGANLATLSAALWKLVQAAV